MLLTVLKPVVDTPHVEWDVFAEMAKNNLQLRIAIKHPVGDHSEGMQTDTMGKRERRAYQPLAILPQLLKDYASWIARVKIERNVKLYARLPEDVPLRL